MVQIKLVVVLFLSFAMDELIPGVPDIFREVDVLLEDWLIDAKMTPEEDWQQVSSIARPILTVGEAVRSRVRKSILSTEYRFSILFFKGEESLKTFDPRFVHAQYASKVTLLPWKVGC